MNLARPFCLFIVSGYFYLCTVLFLVKSLEVKHRSKNGLLNLYVWACSDLLCIWYYQRITESQNDRGWKGPLWVI